MTTHCAWAANGVARHATLCVPSGNTLFSSAQILALTTSSSYE
ncbi:MULTISPECIES: hypothetical protein [unclassified Arthrobacter]|nr:MULTISPECIES: hypothetical protein [unclassified Arthrobacter]